MAALRAHLNLRLSGDVGSGERVRLTHDVRGRSVRHQISAMASGTGTEVNHVIRAAYGFLVVLDHEHRVAQVAEIFQRGQKAAIVAMMQSDGRFIQHVENASQFRSDLSGQTNALALTAG